MTQRAIFQALCDVPRSGAAGALALLLTIPACGGAQPAVSAAGDLGNDVSGHAGAVPAGAEVCALKDALATGGGPDKPMNEMCAKALKSDRLWRKSMVVIGAYADTLDGLAEGDDKETVGPLAAARTGVKGSDWIDVEDGPEKAARDAVAQLVNQMASASAGGDIDKAVKDAAPQIKTICDGLAPYIDTQTKALADAEKEIDKKRVGRQDRRCGQVGGSQSVCVSESVIDRAFYAEMFGHAASLEAAHRDAHAAVVGFCNAHRKLQEAAEKGNLSSKDTYRDVVEAVKAARSAEAAAEASDAPAKK